MKSNEVLIFSTRLAQLLLSNGCELITVRKVMLQTIQINNDMFIISALKQL